MMEEERWSDGRRRDGMMGGGERKLKEKDAKKTDSPTNQALNE